MPAPDDGKAPPGAWACAELEAALEAILDRELYGEHDALAGGFARHASSSHDVAPRPPFVCSVAAHFEPTAPSGAWRPPDALRARATFGPELLAGNGYHIDDGFSGPGFAFALDHYLRTPWVVVVALLTDVAPDQGPTVLLPRSHHTVARVLACAPPGGACARLSLSLIHI